MSYVRIGKDSDVYVHGDVELKGRRRIRCWGRHSSKTVYDSPCGEHVGFVGEYRCWMVHDFIATPAEMIEHLKWHRQHGHKVPPRAFKRLRSETKSTTYASQNFTCQACRRSVHVDEGAGDCLPGCCARCFVLYHEHPKCRAGLRGGVLRRARRDHQPHRCQGKPSESCT